MKFLDALALEVKASRIKVRRKKDKWGGITRDNGFPLRVVSNGTEFFSTGKLGRRIKKPLIGVRMAEYRNVDRVRGTDSRVWATRGGLAFKE